jgi:hypothetical protein
MGLPVWHVVEQHPHRLCPGRRPEDYSIVGHLREIELRDRGAVAKSPSNGERSMIDVPAGRCRFEIAEPASVKHAQI